MIGRVFAVFGDAPELYFDLREEKELDFVRGIFTSGARATQRNVKSNRVLVIKEPLWDRW